MDIAFIFGFFLSSFSPPSPFVPSTTAQGAEHRLLPNRDQKPSSFSSLSIVFQLAESCCTECCQHSDLALAEDLKLDLSGEGNPNMEDFDVVLCMLVYMIVGTQYG